MTTTFQQQLMSYPLSERQVVADEAGISLPYLLKHMYVSGGKPVLRFHNAVRLDSASRGFIPFVQHTEGDIDWDYVRKSLNRAKREGLL